MYKKYTFKVYPKGNAREIYRVIEMAGTKTLDDLCMAIVDAYDFIHEHLYEFCMDNKPYSDECYQYLTEDDETETNVKIDKIKLQKGQNFLLLYDYGDDWLFTIHVQKIEEVKEKVATKVIGEKGELVQYPYYDDEYEDYDEDFEEDYDA